MDCDTCKQLKKEYDELKAKLEEILKLADELCFCTECGGPIGCCSHFCEKCKERVIIPDDQDCFVKYLKKEGFRW